MESTGIAVSERKNVAPWIGVGTQGEWTSVDQALRDCGLDFTVAKQDVLFTYDEDGLAYYDQVPEVQATIRQEDHSPLGCVSDTYTLVQNKDVFSMLEPFVNGGAVITNGGMTEDGLCFMVADTGNMRFGGDDYQVNVMATNSFNGKYPAAIICSPVRIVCQNMYRSLLGNKDNVARFRHSLNVESKLEAIKSATSVFVDFKSHFGDKIERLKQLPAVHSEWDFVEMLFPYANDKTNDELSQRAMNARDRIDEKRMDYVDMYYRSATNSDFGSCFALVNAYYDYISHSEPPARFEGNYQGRRLSNIVGGKAVNMRLIQYMCEHR